MSLTLQNKKHALEKITNRQQQRRLSKWSDYKTLVAHICDGTEPDGDEIATVLADNGKTLDELRDDAKLLARRRKLKADMDAIAPLESEATKVNQQIADAEAAIEELQRKHDEKVSPLYSRRSEINAIRKRAKQAERDLRDSCEDRELVAEYESAVEQLNEAQHELSALEDRIRERESWLRQDTEKAEVSHFVQEQRRYRSQVSEHERILADLQAKMEPIKNSVHDLQERLSATEDQLLKP